MAKKSKFPPMIEKEQMTAKEMMKDMKMDKSQLKKMKSKKKVKK